MAASCHRTRYVWQVAGNGVRAGAPPALAVGLVHGGLFEVQAA
ncbi:Uncharacterised protein [Mycobacteroides abscessus subsp. abscessus]|nr:Uncharacterised protein [Mycobacteroides abscessus subsp. abscessus]